MKQRVISITITAALILTMMSGLIIKPAEASPGYTEIIPPIYDSAANFSSGVAEVEEDGRWYIIDKTGQKIHTFPEYYKDPYDKESFHIDSPHDEPFKDGLALIKKYDWDMREYVYGMIDTYGNVVIEPKYTKIGEFVDGFASVSAIVDKDGTVRGGLIDKKGKEIIPVGTYSIPTDFENGVLRVVVYHSDEPGDMSCGAINYEGKMIVPIKAGHHPDGTYVYTHEGQTLVIVNGYFDDSDVNQSSFIVDINGNMIVPPGKYGKVVSFNDGIFIVESADPRGVTRFGIIDVNGNAILEPSMGHEFIMFIEDGN